MDPTANTSALPDRLRILNNNALKLIAVLSMTIDHVGFILFPGAMWLRCIGRLAFPIYAFLITEGYVHTHNVRRYMLRLGLLALVSEIPFNLAVSNTITNPGSQNIFWTLLLGLLAIWAMDLCRQRLPVHLWSLSLLPVPVACVAAVVLNTDYNCYGVLIICLFYVARQQPLMQFVSIGVLQYLMGYIQLWGQLAFVPIFLYNGKKGRSGKLLQWLFYFYYPVHLLILAILARYI